MADIILKQVYKSFDKSEVLHGITCDISDGEFIVILGPSGCGKSTLLLLIAGLERITKGELRIDSKVGNDLEPGYILPGAMDFRVPPVVAEAAARAGIESGAARIHLDPESVARHTREFIYDERLSLIK